MENVEFKISSKDQLSDLSYMIEIAQKCSIDTLVIYKGSVMAKNDKSTVMRYQMKDAELYKDVSMVISDVPAFKKRLTTFTSLLSTQENVQFTITGVIDQDLKIIKSLNFVCKALSLKMTHACGSASLMKRLPESILDNEPLASYLLTDSDKTIIAAGLSAYNADVLSFTANDIEFNIKVVEQSNKFDYSMTLDKAIEETTTIKVDLSVFKQIMKLCSNITMYSKSIEFDVHGIKLYLTDSLKM